jgi:hypothetical protein
MERGTHELKSLVNGFFGNTVINKFHESCGNKPFCKFNAHLSTLGFRALGEQGKIKSSNKRHSGQNVIHK